jgi:hypothetical protein
MIRIEPDLTLSNTAGLTLGYEITCLASWDTSKAFRQFLGKQGMTKSLLRRMGIRCKEKHTVIPHVSYYSLSLLSLEPIVFSVYVPYLAAIPMLSRLFRTRRAGI